jgi:hypothetical protein
MINQEKRAAIQSISQRINKHCIEIEKLSDALIGAQNSNPNFGLDDAFNPSKSSMLKTLLMNVSKTCKSIRSDVERIAPIKGVDFENIFPKLEIDFTTYYTIAISMLNLIYQMHYMNIYCQRLLKS